MGKDDDFQALPQPFDYCFEWDGPYGTRSFSAAPHNGRPPDRCVPIFRTEQLLAHVDGLARELEEQARLVGMGAERELALLAKVDVLQRALSLARETIQRDRGALYSAHFDFGVGRVNDDLGQQGLDEYDAVLAAIAIAVAPLPAAGEG